MKVIDEARFAVLCDSGEISQHECMFLDGIKIGLRVSDYLLQAQPDVKIISESTSQWSRVSSDGILLSPGHFFLAQTRESISISNRIVGQLHTRSRWARLGLDCLGSSHYISPGFGGGIPISLVLELVPRLGIHLPKAEAVAALILFELDKPVRTASADHAARFPLNYAHPQ